MGTLPSNNPFLFIGRPIKDEYERQIGRIISLKINSNGGVDEVFVDHWNGKFSRFSGSRFEVNGNGVTLLSDIKSGVKELCNEMPLIWRKDQAITGLFEKKKVSSEIFDKFHKDFEQKITKLKADGQTVLEDVNKEISRIIEQIKEVETAKIYLEIEHEIGKIDDKTYQTAMGTMKTIHKKANDEKKDLEGLRNRLSNMLLGESATVEVNIETEAAVPPSSAKLPEPPVEISLKKSRS